MAVEFYITVMWCRKEAFKDYLEVYGYKMKFSDNWEYKQLPVSMKKFQLNFSADIMHKAKVILLIWSLVKPRRPFPLLNLPWDIDFACHVLWDIIWDIDCLPCDIDCLPWDIDY